MGEPPPKISWHRGKSVVSSGDRIQVLPNGSLFIRDVQKTDAGNLSCKANNSHYSDSITYALTVLGKNSFSYSAFLMTEILFLSTSVASLIVCPRKLQGFYYVEVDCASSYRAGTRIHHQLQERLWGLGRSEAPFTEYLPYLV